MNNAPRNSLQSAARFTGRPDGVIVDHESGFEWYALPRSHNWDELMLEKDPTLPGEGWRVPTRAELMTLVTERLNADQLYLDPIFEGVAHAAQVWTADWGDTIAVVWSFDFALGMPVKDWTHPAHHLGVFLLRERT